ncbi:hypothetical protein Tco_1257235 [Tanacetum coccineum]
MLPWSCSASKLEAVVAAITNYLRYDIVMRFLEVVYIGKLTLLEDFYVIDMEKEPTCPLLLGRGFLATASAILIEKKIDWNKPPKEGDGAWHIKIELVDPDGEKFNITFQSIPATRKLSENENPSEIIDLEHFYDS